MYFAEENRYIERKVKNCKKTLPNSDLAGNIPFVSPVEGTRPLTLFQDGPPVLVRKAAAQSSGLSLFLKSMWIAKRHVVLCFKVSSDDGAGTTLAR